MAAAHQDTSSSSANSEGSQMKYKIDVKKKGLFVVIKQVTHNLYFPTDAAEDDWCEQKKGLLNYGPDQEALENLFDLKPSNYIGRTDLENGSGKGSFDGFMKKLCDSEEAEKPEFLMFFLMSHGLKDGKFLLACKKRVNNVSQWPCCQGREHTFGVVNGKAPTDGEKDEVNKCFARDIKDVIRQVCDSKRFSGVPKVFFIQVCRGGEEENLEQLSNPIGTSSDIELFIPDCEDALVIRASTEGYVSKVQDDTSIPGIPSGSLLIQNFCKAVKQLQQSNDERGEVKGRSAGDLTTFLEEHREDLIGGWIMNVCQHATALVTNYLTVEIITSVPSFRKLLTTDADTITKQIHGDQQQSYHEEFVGSLKDYREELKHKLRIGDLIKLCEEKGDDFSLTILSYLWFKVRTQLVEVAILTDQISEDEKEGLQRELNVVNSWITQLIPCSDKLRHFFGHLTYKDISKEASETRTCHLIKEFMQCLKEYASERQELQLVDEVIALCEEHGMDVTQHLMVFLWINLRHVNPLPDYHLQWNDSQNTELEKKLNAMMENIQLQSAYGKQQPHISSSLCKKLSMIDILETQGKATG